MNFDQINHYAQIVWDYHLLHHQLETADMIICFGSNDIRVAEHCAGLWHRKLAPTILFSGGVGRGTADFFHKSEAELFADVAMAKGVPAEAIVLENESRNSGENIIFTRKILQETGLKCQKIILVQKPYMERRVYATVMKQWSGPEFMISSPAIDYFDYPTEEIDRDMLINFMVGDLQRIIEYPALGFQIPQEVPKEVSEAFNWLVAAGYDTHLIK